MKKFSLMSAAAVAALASGASTETEDDGDAGPAPGATPAPSPAPSPTDEGPKKTTEKSEAADEVVDVVAASDVQKIAADAKAAGFAEANTRMGAVFASDEGKADPSTAAFLLANSHASADTIIGQLKAKAPAAAPAAKQTVPDTNVDLGKPAGQDPKALAEEGAPKGDDPWGDTIAQHAADTSPFIPSADAGKEGNVTTPALPRTGN